MAADQPTGTGFASRKATLFATALAIASAVIPFWFWMDTWFGKELSDEQVQEYLTDTERPRRAQHAMAQISGRISAGDESVKAWYPLLLELARHELPELRLTVAWLMGDDPSSDEFHVALLDLVSDPHPMVRRNAALALAKFGDSGGRDEMRGMLQSYRLVSEHAGVVRNRLEPGDTFDAGALLVRVEPEDGGEPLDVRASIPGIVDRQLRADGDRVSSGDEVTVVRPEMTHVMQALLGLYMVGTVEDIPLIQPYQRPRDELGPQVAQQARQTLERIRQGAGGQAADAPAALSN
ncbi:MAG: HEAT repeat domain-containing protein [Bryobacterales bacterium]|nr:HEAT repeat domain-containing protein [Bryobacterales bacterium]